MKMKQVCLTILTLIVLLAANPFDSFSQVKTHNYYSMSLNNVTSHDAVLFPNPVTDNKFKVKSDDLILSIDVINVIGQSIKKLDNNSQTKEDIEILLNNCEKGMYLVKITFQDDKSIIKKLLVK